MSDLMLQRVAKANERIADQMERLVQIQDNTARIQSLDMMLGKAEMEIKRLKAEVEKHRGNAEHAEAEAAHFKRLYDERTSRRFAVGDVIAYMNDNCDGWVCWEVKSIDKSFLYSEENGHGDSIAYAFAYLVKAVEDKR